MIVEDALLEGHLGITRELLAFQSPEKKFHIGSEKGGSNLIKVRNTLENLLSIDMIEAFTIIYSLHSILVSLVNKFIEEGL